MASSASSSLSQPSVPKPNIIGTVTATLAIDNFSNCTDSYKETELISLGTSNINYFGLFLKNTLGGQTWFQNDILTYLWFADNEDHAFVNYKVSIIDGKGDKRNTQEYRWNFKQSDKTGHHFAKYISRDYLLKPENGFLVNGKLTLKCEVQVLDSADSANSNQPNEKCDADRVSNDWETMLQSGKHSDLVLVFGEKQLRAHKLVLITRCPVFSAMFEHEDTKEAQENRIEIIDVQVEVFELFLHYLYSGNVKGLEEYAHELLAAADKFQMASLKYHCEQYLCNILTIESVASLLLLADLYQAPQLKASCINYITDNVRLVKETEEWKSLAARPDLLVELLVLSADKRNLPLNRK